MSDFLLVSLLFALAATQLVVPIGVYLRSRQKTNKKHKQNMARLDAVIDQLKKLEAK